MSNQEIFFPEASEKPPLADPSQNLSTPKSYVTAYFIWLFLGIIGGHRFYLGKWFTGLLYAVSFGFLGVGWLLDFFLIVPMVKSARKKATLQVLSEANVPEEAPLPPWAKESSFFGLLELPFQIMFFLFFPGILVIFAVLLHQIEFAIMIVVLLALVGLLGSFQKTLLQYPFLDKIPALGDAISIVTDLHKFYYNNKPRSFLYYLFYPVSGFIGILFSEKSRIEFKLYLKILGSLLLVLIIDTIFSYSSLYPPHLDWKDAIFIIFLQLIMMFFALLSLVIPMVSTSFQWNLQGRKRTSQFFTFLGLSLAIFLGIFGYLQDKKSISVISKTILDERFKKNTFKEELTQASEMFLFYHARQITPEDRENVIVHQPWTEKYRRLIGTIAVNDEVNAFDVILIQENSSLKKTWIGIKLNLSQQKAHFLYIVDPEGVLYASWEYLPESITSQLKMKSGEKKAEPWEITEETLLKDWNSN